MRQDSRLVRTSLRAIISFQRHTPLNRRYGISVAITLISANLSASVLAETALIRRVAMTGDIAPATSSELFTEFGTPIINDSGQLSFVGRLSGPSSHGDGIWSYLNGDLQLLARKGDAAPDSDGRIHAGFSGARVNILASGDTVFTGFTTAPDTTTTGDYLRVIWLSSAGGLLPLAPPTSSFTV
ncbi:choice-of-anchor tandem repeat NxxGxxAF-containing protein [Botrimarina sp.]|uniref:DUF7453 family protein n=1 Tax=Botrimarina sp. TaxID=2795802 RepID=UPI0032EFEC2C